MRLCRAAEAKEDSEGLNRAREIFVPCSRRRTAVAPPLTRRERTSQRPAAACPQQLPTRDAQRLAETRRDSPAATNKHANATRLGRLGQPVVQLRPWHASGPISDGVAGEEQLWSWLSTSRKRRSGQFSSEHSERYSKLPVCMYKDGT